VKALPLDLHVLGTPPAFILSQDQTLHKKNLKIGANKLALSEKNSNVFTICTYLKKKLTLNYTIQFLTYF